MGLLLKVILLGMLFLQTMVIRTPSDNNTLLSPDELARLLPARLEGFNLIEQNKGRMIQIGTLTYSMTERGFSKSKRKVTILLFDYNNASIMYRQATGKWANQVSEDNEIRKQGPYPFESGEGWEHYDKIRNYSQLFLGVHGRFYIVLTGEGIGMEELYAICNQLNASSFPPLSHAVADAKHR